MTDTTLENRAAATRAAIEKLLARYPDLTADEVATVKRYLRKEGSALDRASVASNADIEQQYRQFCRDHHFDRLRPFEIALVISVLMAAFVIIAVTYQFKAW